MTDIYEGHSPHCQAVQPGDRECNCHLAYGFATAEAMEEHDLEHSAGLVEFYEGKK